MASFLPFITGGQPPLPQILGVETTRPVYHADLLRELRPDWVRWNGARWPDELGRTELAALNDMDSRVIVVYQANGFIPSPEQYVEFASALTELAAEYPNIYAWEIWNEPDAPFLFGSSYFLGGGWESDPAGYAQMFAAVREANPDLRLLSGGLAAFPEWLQAALNAGARPDGVSFHSYNYHPDATTESAETWVRALRAFTGLPLYLTETSVLCGDWDCSTHDAAKASYLIALYDYAKRHNLSALVWYTVGDNNWQRSDLIGASRDAFIELQSR